MSTIDYSQAIPNNVNLSSDRVLQRALEQWQPNFLSWWGDMGPVGALSHDVYLRTATSAHPSGWAHFDYVKMPDYRWGIFLAPQVVDRKIHFGEELGKAVWQDVPGEHRANLRRIIVTQGDTEPASVEQQRHLGLTAPSLYDLRNLFQINVEEGRHLWAMVYLLHRFFGRDGREEADALLQRRSGHQDNPRILGAFNEATPDWLSFFMFTYFTDRDGKFQLCALAESSFDPLARTTRFMLMEEAHHMYVGESGVARVIARTCEVMKQHNVEHPDQVRAHGGDRFSNAAAVSEFSLQRDLGFVRRRSIVECRHFLQFRFERSLRRKPAPRRSCAQGPDLQDPRGGEWCPRGTGSAHAECPERSPARRLHSRLGQRCVAVEQGDRESRLGISLECSSQGLQPSDRHPIRCPYHARRAAHLPGRMERRQKQLAGDFRGSGLCGIADAAQARARPVCRLDRGTDSCHQQAAARPGVRPLLAAARIVKKPPAPATEPLLIRIGERVRNLRAIRGMSRKALAKDAEVSERFLADLESGVGNASIMLLNRLADALALPLSEIVGGDDARADLSLSVQLLSRLNDADLQESRQWLQARFTTNADDTLRLSRIALIGLRGAGKSTLGRKLAEALHYRFVELDQTIEDLSGMDSTQIHSMLGQSAYRRYEFDALRSIVDGAADKLVIAVPGSIVSEANTFNYLLTHCLAIWIKATPEEHMSRVIAQGDMRPMSGNREAMNDLRRILATREPLYAKADIAISTAGRSVEESLEELLKSIPDLGVRRTPLRAAASD